MGVAVGNCDMEEKQIFQNVQMSVNFLVSLLKKNWQNVSILVSFLPLSQFLAQISQLLYIIPQLPVFSSLLGEVLVPEEHHGEDTTCLLRVRFVILLLFGGYLQ